MSGFSFSIPESGELPLWPCCQNCPRQGECPYVYNLRIFRAARQGRETADFLTEEACRYRERISCAGSLHCLLEPGEELERALSQALQSELSAIGGLCPQADIPCL